jgi:hypothetical protein
LARSCVYDTAPPPTAAGAAARTVVSGAGTADGHDCPQLMYAVSGPGASTSTPRPPSGGRHPTARPKASEPPAASAGSRTGRLLPLLLVLAALPHGWASVRAARVEYLSMIARMGVRRRKWLLSDLMADRDTAAAVRAYTAGPYLLERYAALARRDTAAHLRVARQQSAARAVGAVLAGLGPSFRFVRFTRTMTP